jgi:mono/diheme cytochrome c family protein
MRSVHLLGVGMVVGMLAMGGLLAVMGYQWQEANYAGKIAKTGFPPEGAPGEASPQEIAQGRGLFQQRCAGCHTIGEGDRAGPDLEGVTNRRPYAWVQEIIVDPQRLIDRSDPIMVEIMGQYPATMPDTGTSPVEAARIIAFLHSESPEPAPPIQVPAEGTPEPAGKEPAQTPATKT